MRVFKPVVKPLIVEVVESAPGTLSISWDKEADVFTFSVYYSLTEDDYKRLILAGLSAGENNYTNTQQLEATGYSNVLGITLSGVGVPYYPGQEIWFWLTATNSNTGVEGPFSKGYAIKLKEE